MRLGSTVFWGIEREREREGRGGGCGKGAIEIAPGRNPFEELYANVFCIDENAKGLLSKVIKNAAVDA